MPKGGDITYKKFINNIIMCTSKKSLQPITSINNILYSAFLLMNGPIRARDNFKKKLTNHVLSSCLFILL